METEIIKITDVDKQQNIIRQIGEVLRCGEVIAIPTETVYGLAANARDEAAVKKIFDAKGRPQDNPLIVHISTISELPNVAEEIPQDALRLALKYWPGPLTMVLKRRSDIPASVSAGLDTVAVRCPSHPVANAIIRAAGVPLAAPSANRSGRPSPTTAAHVYDDLKDRIRLIVDGGACSVGVESTVLDLTSTPPRLLRPGAVTVPEIEAAIGKIEIDKSLFGEIDPDEKVSSPGMKYRHYAPKAPVEVYCGKNTTTLRAIMQANPKPNEGVLCFTGCESLFPFTHVFAYGKADDYSAQAKNLFAALRACDDQRVRKIYAQCPPDEGLALAVANRLKKAGGFELVNCESELVVIGLTGKSGTGKTTVASVFGNMGAAVLDADRIYEDLSLSDDEMRVELVTHFGPWVIRDGQIDRRALAKKIYDDKKMRQTLNLITHRHVIREISRQLNKVEKQGYRFAVIDAPLLFESAANELCDITVGVIASKADLIKRIMSRDGIDLTETLKRLDAQPDEKFYYEHCDMIIRNNGTKKDLTVDSEGVFDKIQKIFSKGEKTDE